MAGFGNEIVYADGFKLTPTSVDSLSRMQSAPTDVASINYTGNPEGFVSANPSSLCHDPVSGDIYAKITGSGNTGWSNINSSSGDVVGPASSADDNLVVFDGITGKVIKDTGISSIAPTFTGNASSLTRVIAPYDTTAGEGFYFSDGTVAARQVGTAAANYFFGNAGNSSLSGIANTGVGQAALVNLTSGIQNTGMGNGSLLSVTSGGGNSAYGYFSLFSLQTGICNTAIGFTAMQVANGCSNCVGIGRGSLFNVTGDENIGIGYNAGKGITSGIANITIGSGTIGVGNGSYNTAIGNGAGNQISGGIENTLLGNLAMASITTGSYNVAIGSRAGSACVTGSELGNIYINNNGVNNESHATRVGDNNTLTCYIAGISGVTVPASTAVLIDANGQMGTILSSARYKENIVDMPKDISVMNLRPVQFTYKTNNENEVNNLSYGLIAEEVDRVFPYLCVYKDGQPETVKYHELCVFLLAEIQKLEKRLLIIERKDS